MEIEEECLRQASHRLRCPFKTKTFHSVIVTPASKVLSSSHCNSEYSARLLVAQEDHTARFTPKVVIFGELAYQQLCS